VEGQIGFRFRINYFILDQLCAKHNLRLSFQLRGGQWEPIIPWEVDYVTRQRVQRYTEGAVNSECSASPAV
jgi:hypothetical protein